MVIAPLPKENLAKLQAALLPEFKIEVPMATWIDTPLVRVLVQAYTPEHMEWLLGAIEKYL
jgi:hypothetical protein